MKLKIIFFSSSITMLISCASINQDQKLNTGSKMKKGSILLVHGSAPFNSDGKVPDLRAGIYNKTTFFKDIKNNLESDGWNIVTYSKPGVFEDHIDYKTYSTTDLKSLGDQLRTIWKTLPNTKPRLVLGWSEGSLHIAELPLNEVDGVIVVGGIANNIKDVILSQEAEKKEIIELQLKEIEKLPRTEMLGLDRPAGRLIDELKLPPNWTRFTPHPELPILVLHGSTDSEVPMSEAYAWKKYLPNHMITLEIFEGKNHMLGKDNDAGVDLIGSAINDWWNNK